jgi:hypothetical protein
MELAIPLIALCGMYIVSNQTQKKENFRTRESLPNIDIPDKNYPNDEVIDESSTSKLAVSNAYGNGGDVYTDKYFNPNSNEEFINKQITSSNYDNQSEYTSLTGQNVQMDYFRHNNMTPFFGSKSHETNASNANEATMDNYTGGGSQYKERREQAPLFSPGENVQYAHGAPNNTDFIRSRINPSTKMTGVTPFESIKVGPGLGMGLSSEGQGGYNSGMMARDQWREKTVDELRASNNPKASGIGLLGFEGPANSAVKNMGQMGIMEKNRVDTAFEMGPDRLFTTTGIQKNPALRAVPMPRHVNRPETSTNYSGVASSSNPAHYVKGEYMPSTNIQLGETPIPGAYARGKAGAYNSDYGAKSGMLYQNNRSANLEDNQYYGAVGGAIKSAMAPILDMLRPSRKENSIGNLRPYQNVTSRVSNSYVFDPADRMAPTIRETTEKSKNHLNINSGQGGGGYESTQMQPVRNQRDTTTDFFYAGNASAGERGRQPRQYDAEYNQQSNGIKSSTLQGYTPAGGMSLLNSEINMSAKPKDNYLANTRPVQQTRSHGTIPSASNMGSLQGSSNSLYDGIQYDRNNGDVLNQLKGNPYTHSVLGAI